MWYFISSEASLSPPSLSSEVPRKNQPITVHLPSDSLICFIAFFMLPLILRSTLSDWMVSFAMFGIFLFSKNKVVKLSEQNAVTVMGGMFFWCGALITSLHCITREFASSLRSVVFE